MFLFVIIMWNVLCFFLVRCCISLRRDIVDGLIARRVIVFVLRFVYFSFKVRCW